MKRLHHAFSITFLLFVSSSYITNAQSVDSLVKLGTIKCYEQPDSAIQLFNIALKIESKNKNAIIAKINCLISSGRAVEALDYTNSQISSDSMIADFYFIRGVITNYLSPTDSSCLSDYRKAIQLNPDYIAPIYNIGVFYYNLAADVSNQYKAQVKKEKLLLNQKKHYLSRAMIYMERLLNLDPDMKEIQKDLLVIYTELNLTEKKKEMEQMINNNNQ